MMKKAKLIIDYPYTCNSCKLMGFDTVLGRGKYMVCNGFIGRPIESSEIRAGGGKPEWCPLVEED